MGRMYTEKSFQNIPCTPPHFTTLNGQYISASEWDTDQNNHMKQTETRRLNVE